MVVSSLCYDDVLYEGLAPCGYSVFFESVHRRQPMEQDYKEAKTMAVMFHPTSGQSLNRFNL